MMFQVTKYFFYRIANGTAAAITIGTYKTMYPKKFHYGKEVFQFRHSSFTLPKRSPLRVDQRIVYILKIFAADETFNG